MYNNLEEVKRVKIVYFTGTGSTKKVADCFEKNLTERGIGVIKTELREGWQHEDATEDLLIVLYAVHACNAPEPVYEWIDSTPSAAGIPAVVISVSGGGEVTPNTACRLHCISRLQKKGYRVVYEKMLVMPSNWIVQTKDGLAVRLLEVMPLKIERVISEVLSGVTRRTKPNLLNRMLSELGELEKLGGASFGRNIKVSDGCSGCGWCERNCPRANIKMDKGKPIFDKRCLICLKCLYGCPEKALKAGSMKFIVVKEGYDLKAVEKRMEGVQPAPVEELAQGYLWKGVKKYLLEQD